MAILPIGEREKECSACRTLIAHLRAARLIACEPPKFFAGRICHERDPRPRLHLEQAVD
jgi:hypothetical protein